jgi:hypothetical protein
VMAQLVLGPHLRYVDEHSATIWVETDVACEVEVLGRRARTFHVSGHHYALVALEGLRPGEEHEYSVALDGERGWPSADRAGAPAGHIAAIDPASGLRVVFGSCRAAAPDRPPWTRQRSRQPEGRGVDALGALATRLQTEPRAEWPSLLLMVGDQVYADDSAPETRAFIRARRSTDGEPGEQVADFEEYTRLYREAWSEPAVRWLLSAVPSAMIFDDHEVVDDWNISDAWRREMSARPWWADRISGAVMSYWLYQHLGNLSPDELRADPVLAAVRAARDGGPLLREFALSTARGTSGTRWSYSRQLGSTRLVVLDSRAGRVLTPAHREMLDAEQWRWLEGEMRGDVDHLLLGTSLPYLLPRAIHDAEAWSEAVCDGVWGSRAARLGERLRRMIDLEHWAAFRSSFDRLARALAEISSGRRGRPPASIVLLSGDVHYGYLAEVSLPGGGATRIFQAVSSPFRQDLSAPMQLANRLAFTRLSALAGAVLIRTARLRRPPIGWRMHHGPVFANQFATLEILGPSVRLRLDSILPGERGLRCVAEIELTGRP